MKSSVILHKVYVTMKMGATLLLEKFYGEFFYIRFVEGGYDNLAIYRYLV